MAPSSKTNAAAKDRRKSSQSTSSRDSKLVTLKVSPDRLRAIIDPTFQPVKEDTPVKEVQDSPSNSTPLGAPATANAENGSESNPATPANGGTPAPSVMGPPGEGQGPKKKGIKRSAATANGDGQPKVRGKPGPKKRQRMEDGSLEPIRANAHRLGPKANQGAINAGLRALDRSGKPCRKWTRGNFQLKTFTGVHWEISRWSAPPKPKPIENSPDDVPASGPVSTDGGSSKENKENGDGQLGKSGDSNSGGDVEMQSIPSVQASSPAPMPIVAGA